jgi:MATE family multidrug resistance protein
MGLLPAICVIFLLIFASCCPIQAFAQGKVFSDLPHQRSHRNSPLNFVLSKPLSQLMDKSMHISSLVASEIGGNPKDKQEIQAKPQILSSLPCMEELDRRILLTALPAALHLAIIPLVALIDSRAVGKLNNPLAFAGQGAANQVFSSAIWMLSFLPNVITPLVAKAQANGDLRSVQERYQEAMIVTSAIGILGTFLLVMYPEFWLKLVMKGGLPAKEYAIPFLTTRAATFLPALLSLVNFAIFRGTQDIDTPLKISIAANIVNLILKPIFMFQLHLQLIGSAYSSCTADIITFVLYSYLLSTKNILSIPPFWKGWKQVFQSPKTSMPTADDESTSAQSFPDENSVLLKWKKTFFSILTLMKSAVKVQSRTFALNFSFMMVTRYVQTMDTTGVSAAAHGIALNLFQFCSIPSLALNTVSNSIIPLELAKARQSIRELTTGNPVPTSQSGDHSPCDWKFSSSPTQSQELLYSKMLSVRHIANRLYVWGIVLGILLAGLQILSLYTIGWFTKLPDVHQKIVEPLMIGAGMQFLHAIVWIGEGIQQGTEDFQSLALATIVGSIGMMSMIYWKGYSLNNIWLSFGILGMVRLFGVLYHHFVAGPLAMPQLRKILTTPATSVTTRLEEHKKQD